MKKLILCNILFIFYSGVYAQQIKIYHGVNGATEIIETNIGIGTQKSIPLRKGEKLQIQVMNPHPDLYQYNFNTETIKEQEDIIDGNSNLISYLNLLLSQGPSGESIRGNSNSGGRVPASSAVATWQNAYLLKIETFKEELNKAKNIIIKSDNPETLLDVIGKIYSNNGYQWAKEQLKSIPFFTNKNLENEVKQWSIDFKSTSSDYNHNIPTEKLTMEIYDNFAKSLLSMAQSIQKTYDNEISTTLNYIYTVGDSTQIIHLSIKNKSEELKGRQTGDKIISITIQPKFNRAVLEFIPVANFIQSKDGIKYSIKNNLIVSEKDENFKFRVGGILNFNFKTWGPRSEYSLGIGAGFAISENELNTFYGSILLSYKKWVRFGIGYGALNVPTFLKEGAQVGFALPSTISNLNEVVGYNKKPAFIFTFVIPGLTLPILK